MDDLTVTVAGKVYGGWKTATVTRRLQHMASTWELSVAEAWVGQRAPEQLMPFAPCTIAIGNDVILTGYIDSAHPAYNARSHEVRIAGRSRTEDIIDCTPDLPGGQFLGYRLDAIARAVAGLFGIEVVVDADVGEPFPDATILRNETGYAFLERLARLRSVLLTDDAQGRLVITTTGKLRADDALEQGRNILAASADFSGARRFQEYRVKTQAGAQPRLPVRRIDAAPPAPNPAQSVEQQRAAAAAYDDDAAVVQSQVSTVTTGIAYDHGVPRRRIQTVIGESALDAAGSQRRAEWQARFAAADGTRLVVEVQGWRQRSGKLWQHNHLVAVKSPWARVDQDLLIAGVTWQLGPQGRITRLELGPPDAFTPDPGQVRARRAAGGGGGQFGLVVTPIPRGQ